MNARVPVYHGISNMNTIYKLFFTVAAFFRGCCFSARGGDDLDERVNSIFASSTGWVRQRDFCTIPGTSFWL
jgi:hypothetical protein